MAQQRVKGQAVAPKALMGPLRELTPKHKLLAQYVVNGVDKAHLLRGVYRKSPTEDDPDRVRELKVGEPLRVEEAAKVLGFRLRHARHLFTQAVFQKFYHSEIAALRDGAKADAVRKTIEVLNDPGDGSAAWAKVNLAAAQMILGEPGDGKGGNVNVTVNTAIQLQPGIVIRLKDGIDKPPLELQAEEDA